MNVESTYKKLTIPEKNVHREMFTVLNIPAKVKLKNPELRFVLFEVYTPAHHRLTHVFFGRHFTDGGRSLVRGGSALPLFPSCSFTLSLPQMSALSLKKRVYLGPTSLASEIAMYMANQALAKPGTFMMDPFVGTGSMIICLEKFGASTLGADIDMRVFRGKQGRNIHTSFKQYALGVPELVGMDNSLRCIRHFPMFHAIVCDPPYAIRAGARKSGLDPSSRRYVSSSCSVV